MAYVWRAVSRWIWPAAPISLPSLANEGRLCWIDLEMTGLEAHDRIIEIACIVTDRHLQPLDDGVSYPIKTDKAVLDAMGEWCTNQHRGTGLTQEALNAKHSMREVEQLVLDYVRVRMPESGKALLAGSSVHVDKRWLLKDMPRLHSHLHYRICDVSTIKELMIRWDPTFLDRRKADQQKKPADKGTAHRALADIRWSIEELRWYKENVFKLP